MKFGSVRFKKEKKLFTIMLKRKGKLMQDSENNLVLVNEKDKGYRVDEVVAVIWSKADGKTLENLVKEIAEETQLDEAELRPHIEMIINKLKEVDLVEVQ